MVKSLLFDVRQLLYEYPETPHYLTDLVCFRSDYHSRAYPMEQQYFNHELTLVLIIKGSSEVCINGEKVSLSAGSMLLHGSDYLTGHEYSSEDIDFITLYISSELLSSDIYLNQIVSMLLASLRNCRQYTVSLMPDKTILLQNHLEELMSVLHTEHSFMRRKLLALCNIIFLDIAEWISGSITVRHELSKREDLLQHFHALVTAYFRTEHQVSFYSERLAVSKQYLARIVREATGKTVNDILEELLLSEAERLLLIPSYTIGKVSEELNFSDIANFCRFFKRRMGITPLKYKKKMIEKSLGL